jgi:hypothetical protein
MKFVTLCAVLLTVAAATMSATPLYIWNFDDSVAAYYSGYTEVGPPFVNNAPNPADNTFYPEGVYGITTDPQSGHPSWVTMGDHTTGGGNMMVVNGAPDNGVVVWRAPITVQAGHEYVFSFWMANVYATSPAQLGVDTDIAGPPVVHSQIGPWSSPAGVGAWQQFSIQFVAPSNNFELQIFNRNTIANGNDFALDDMSLSLANVPEPASFGIAGIGIVVLAGLLRRRRS